MIPDKELAKAHIKTLYGSFDKKLHWQFLDSSTKRMSPRLFLSLKEAWSHILKAQKEQREIFYRVNILEAGGVKKSDVKALRFAYFDFDGVKVPKVFNKTIKPCLITGRSGNRSHVYLRMEDGTKDINKYESILKKLTIQYKADEAVASSNELLRLAGTWNFKDKKNIEQYKIVYIEKEQKKAYSLSELEGYIEESKEAKEGGRNVFLFKEALKLSKKGYSKEDLRDLVFALRDEKCQKDGETHAVSDQEVDGILSRINEYAKKKDKELEELEDLLSDFYHIVRPTCWVDIKKNEVWSELEFNRLMSADVGVVGVTTNLLSQGVVNQAKFLKYEPNKDTILEDAVNVYRPSDIKSVEGNADWFIDHCSYLFSETKERDHFLDWISYLFQFPGQKIKHAILLVGGFGIGKSFLFDIMSKLLGKSNVSSPGNSNLKDTFKPYYKFKQLVFVHEIYQPTNKDFENEIKSIITEDIITIREPYQAPYETRNTLNFLCLSNYIDSLDIHDGDRRWFVSHCQQFKKSPEYYDALFNSLNDDKKLGAIMHFLLNRDIRKFNPNAPPPFTEGKVDAIASSKSDFVRWLDEQYQLEAPPFESRVLSMSEVCKSCTEIFPELYRGQTVKRVHGKVARYLNEKGAWRLQKRDVESGKPVSLYVIKWNKDQYKNDKDIRDKIIKEVDEKLKYIGCGTGNDDKNDDMDMNEAFLGA